MRALIALFSMLVTGCGDGLQQQWLVKGHGCAMWSLLFRK